MLPDRQASSGSLQFGVSGNAWSPLSLIVFPFLPHFRNPFRVGLDLSLMLQLGSDVIQFCDAGESYKSQDGAVRKLPPLIWLQVPVFK